jgi:hypothetical protein
LISIFHASFGENVRRARSVHGEMVATSELRRPWRCCKISAARSPMVTQGAMVFPHDGSVGNTKMFDAVNLQIAIHDGHGISAHFGCTGFMPVTDGRVAYEFLQFWPGHVARHDFALDKLL